MNLTIVLYETQQLVNLGGTVRVLLNTGQTRLRLVRPASFDAARIDDLAHRSAEIVARTTLHETLEDALTGMHTVVGFSARQRAQRRPTPWITLAPTISALAAVQPVALLFGREDWGLPNAALDQCSHVCWLPVDPAYPSLNLAHAVLLAIYELQRAQPASAAPALAPRGDVEQILALVEQALVQTGFSRTPGQQAATMRTLRDLVERAAPAPQEAALLQALARRALRSPDQE